MIILDLIYRIALIGITIIISILFGAYLGATYSRKKQQKLTQRESKNPISDEEKNDSDVREVITKSMEELRSKINVDYIGLAIYDGMTDEIRWRLAVGASNSRYKRIVIRMGKGIAGEVIQLNRTVKIEDFPHDVLGNPIEYPILLVEHLKSVIAVPVEYNLRIYGVLMIGHREIRKYNDNDEQETLKAAGKIAQQLGVANIYSRVISDKNDTNEPIREAHINESLFVNYLIGQSERLPKEDRGQLVFEILDQSIIELSDGIQQLLILNMEEILNKLAEKNEDLINVSIARDESSLMIETTINRAIPNAKELFEEVYQNIGEIGGSIISYHDKDYLHFIMQLPLWSYKNPLS